MANRDTTQFRDSIQQVAPDVSSLQTTIAEVGQNIIKAGQDAKITENFSKAQLDINRLNLEYQTKYEANPFQALPDIKARQDEILSSYGEDISPFFKRSWEDNARELGTKNEGVMEAWAYGQTKKNTVVSINQGIKANMSQASMDGQTFGSGDSEEIGSMLNFAQSKSRLAGFGDKHLGATETTQLLSDYDNDYLKSFLSGVSQTNPTKALRLMEKPEVQASFKDKGHYLQMKTAIENRAFQIDDITTQKQILDTLKNENSLLTRSISDNVSYADLQQEFSKNKMSKSAQDYFLKANGFTRGGEKLTDAAKLANKSQLYTDMTKLMNSDSLSTQDAAAFQERIYQGMNNGSITEKEGVNFINQLSAPLIGQKEGSFSTFSQDSWISPDVGFGGVQEEFEKNIKQSSVYDVPITAAQRDSNAIVEQNNNMNKVKLYDYYMSALQQRAESYGVPLADVKNLNKTQQRKLYSEAQAEAVKQFHIDQNPSLSTLNDIPNQTFTGGKLIQGAAGSRNLKPDVSVTPTFESYKGSDGYIYRKYPDGKYERVGAAPNTEESWWK